MIWFLIGFVIGGLLFLHHCEKHPVDQHEIEVRDILRKERKRDKSLVHEKRYRYTTAGVFEEGEDA
jgi:hypothetical protein